MRGQSRTKVRALESTATSEEGVVLLVQRAQARDKDAFTALHRRYDRPLWGLIWRRLEGRASRQDMEDIHQDTFMKAYRSIGTFNFKSLFSTWLFAIAIYGCNNWLRDRCKLPFATNESDSDGNGGPGVGSHENRTICFIMAEKVYAKMAPNWQRIIKRVLWNGERAADIAADEGMNQDQVRYVMRVFWEKLSAAEEDEVD